MWRWPDKYRVTWGRVLYAVVLMGLWWLSTWIREAGR